MIIATWNWGWDSLVAIGTLALAAGTVGVMIFTARLASRTAQDIAGQHRPFVTTAPGSGAAFIPASAELVLSVFNTGPGPALDVQATVGPIAASPWNKGAIPSGHETGLLRFAGVPTPQPKDRVTVELAYRDIGGHRYLSSIVLRCTNPTPVQPGQQPTLQIDDVVISSA